MQAAVLLYCTPHLQYLCYASKVPVQGFQSAASVLNSAVCR